MSSNAKNSLDKAMDELTRTRDEVRVGLHLLSMEAKERWTGLEARLREIDDELREKGEAASEVSAEKVHEIARSIRDFVTRHVRNIGAPAR